MVGLIIFTVLGGYTLIYSVKMHEKAYFLAAKGFFFLSESTKLRVLYHQVCTNYTGSIQSYMLSMWAVW